MNVRRSILVALLLLVPATAQATGQFPFVVEDELQLQFGPPPCSVCHLAGMQARYSVRTPFGQALRVRGLVRYDDASLRRAIDALRDQGVDSDGDGVSDTDELLDGTDPNLPEGLDPVSGLGYGCAAAGPSRPHGGGWLLVLSPLALAVTRRRAPLKRCGSIARGALRAPLAVWGLRAQPVAASRPFARRVV